MHGIRVIFGMRQCFWPVATGGRRYCLEFERGADAHMVDAWQVLRGEASVGAAL